MSGVSPKTFLPPVGLALLTLLAALPWGLPSEARFLMPLLPLAAIHFWAAHHPAAMPEWLVFVSGLAIDVLTHGPLGYWSLVFLLGFVLARLLPQADAPRPSRDWLHFCATLVLLTGFQWMIASAYFLDTVDWRPFLRGAVIASVVYPLLAMIFRSLDRLWSRPADMRFGRG